MTSFGSPKEILGVDNAQYGYGDGLPAAARSIPPHPGTAWLLLIDLQLGPTRGLVPYSTADWLIYSIC